MPRAALDTSAGFLERAFHFNVTAPFTLTKLAARRMVDTSGSGAIVNISSRSASMTQTSFAAYGAVKAALDRLTRNMAPELAPRVRLNAIDVGGVATRSLEIVLTDDTLRASSSPGRRWAGPAIPRTSPAPSSTWSPTQRPGSRAKCSRSTAGLKRRPWLCRRRRWSLCQRTRSRRPSAGYVLAAAMWRAEAERMASMSTLRPS